jgi:hypothetical protein
MKTQLFILTALFILTTGMAGCEGEEKFTEKKIEMQDISLEQASYFCWQDIEMNKVILINSEQELSGYFSCSNCILSEWNINFDNYSLLVARGIAGGGIGLIEKTLMQTSPTKYSLNIDITFNLIAVANEPWQIASLIPKLPQGTKVSLDVNQHY